MNGTDLAAALIRSGFCARCPGYDPFMRYLPTQLEAGSWRINAGVLLIRPPDGGSALWHECAAAAKARRP